MYYLIEIPYSKLYGVIIIKDKRILVQIEHSITSKNGV